MTAAALSIAFGKVELLVARRRATALDVTHRSAFRIDSTTRPERIVRQVLDTLRTARSLGASEIGAVVVPNGPATALATRLTLATGTEVRLLRDSDSRALVFAGATLGRPSGTPVVVCALEDGHADIGVGSVGALPRWTASVTFGPETLIRGGGARRLTRVIEGLGLPGETACLLTGSGARSLRLALAAHPDLTAGRIVDDVAREGLAALEPRLAVSAVRARRIALAAVLAAALGRATGGAPTFTTGGLLEGALVDPSGIAGRLVARELVPAEVLG